MPCGASTKGVIYKMKFCCIATWIQRGQAILNTLFNNILDLLTQFHYKIRDGNLEGVIN